MAAIEASMAEEDHPIFPFPNSSALFMPSPTPKGLTASGSKAYRQAALHWVLGIGAGGESI